MSISGLMRALSVAGVLLLGLLVGAIMLAALLLAFIGVSPVVLAASALDKRGFRAGVKRRYRRLFGFWIDLQTDAIP